MNWEMNCEMKYEMKYERVPVANPIERHQAISMERELHLLHADQRH